MRPQNMAMPFYIKPSEVRYKNFTCSQLIELNSIAHNANFDGNYHSLYKFPLGFYF